MADEQVSTSGTSSFADRVSREATWMQFAAFLACLTFFAVLIVKGILGATFGSIWHACKTICCPRRAKIAPDQPVCTDGEEMTWDRAFGYIERTRPPASYKMENN